MKKISKKQKIIGAIAIIVIAVILAIVITTNIVSNNNVESEGYAATANASSSLVASYIKKGITIGGITGTLETLDTSDADATPEDILWGKTAYVKGEKITGTYRTLGMLNVGDYVAYMPDSASSYSLSSNYSGNNGNPQIIEQENLNWRILSVNTDGTVDLISDAETKQSIYFGAEKGYNNGVYILNDIIAKLYSSSKYGGVTARSLTIEDIEDGMTEEGREYVHNYTSEGVMWGQTKTFTSSNYIYYPNLYAEENGSGIDLATTNDPYSEVKKDGINQSDSSLPITESSAYASASKSLTVTQTYYSKTMNSSYYKDSTFFNLIHSGYNEYWLASRYVKSYYGYADFGIRKVNTIDLDGDYVFSSFRVSYYNDNCLRPVVSLKANLRIKTGDGQSPSTAYQIAE